MPLLRVATMTLLALMVLVLLAPVTAAALMQLEVVRLKKEATFISLGGAFTALALDPIVLCFVF